MTKFILFILAIGMVSCSVKEVTRNKLEIPPTIDMSTPVEVKSAPAPASKVYIDQRLDASSVLQDGVSRK